MKNLTFKTLVLMLLIIAWVNAGVSQIPKVGDPVKIGQCFPSLIPNAPWDPLANYIFTNMFLLAQFDGNPNPDQNASDFTADTWPTRDFSLRMPRVFKAGTHYVEFEGIADVNLYGSAVAGNVKLAQNYNATTKKTYARFTMNTANGDFYLRFSNVRSSVVKNIKVYGPDYLTGTGATAVPNANIPTFTNELYKALAAYPSIDFDAVQEPDAQNNGERTWSNRTLPTQMQYSSSQILSRIDFYTAAGTNVSFMYPNNDTLYSRT